MKHIKWLMELRKDDVLIAGGKGASLGEMYNSDILVPNAFVITAHAFDYFLEQTDINVEIDTMLHSVDKKEISSITLASEKISSLIFTAEIPETIIEQVKDSFKKLNAEFVAVRSSATMEDSLTATWAGQLATYLNTKEEDLLQNIKKCWASLFTPAAIFYRSEQKLHQKPIAMAVVIQKMVESEVAGVAFSVNPITRDHNQIIIEASYGLGEAIVSGQVTPDQYVIEKSPRRIIDKNVVVQKKALYRGAKGGNQWQDLHHDTAKKSVLNDEQILRLAQMVLTIEEHYGFPVDIEWAGEKDKFYAVQSRAITTL